MTIWKNGAFSKLFLKKFSWILGKIWDGNWKESNIYYNARGTGSVNIKEVFKNTAEGDNKLNSIAESFKNWTDIDKRALEIARYVNRRMTYKTDFNNYGKTEYWASPYEVWRSKVDDCDGYAVLIKDLMDKAGIPEFRSKVAAGDTDVGGHAYVLYLKEHDNEWYTIEGSYYADEAFTRFHNSVPHMFANKYQRIWFTFRCDKSWAQHDMIIRGGIHE